MISNWDKDAILWPKSRTLNSNSNTHTNTTTNNNNTVISYIHNHNWLLDMVMVMVMTWYGCQPQQWVHYVLIPLVLMYTRVLDRYSPVLWKLFRSRGWENCPAQHWKEMVKIYFSVFSFSSFWLTIELRMCAGFKIIRHSFAITTVSRSDNFQRFEYQFTGSYYCTIVKISCWKIIFMDKLFTTQRLRISIILYFFAHTHTRTHARTPVASRCCFIRG